MARTSARTSRPPLKYLWRHTPKGDDHLFGAIREHCQCGGEVRIQRTGTTPYSIVLNGGLWLARPIDGSPIGTFDCIAAAVLASDKYMVDAEDDRAQREADFGPDDPGSAA